jgi:hypothetical protein
VSRGRADEGEEGGEREAAAGGSGSGHVVRVVSRAGLRAGSGGFIGGAGEELNLMGFEACDEGSGVGGCWRSDLC